MTRLPRLPSIDLIQVCQGLISAQVCSGWVSENHKVYPPVFCMTACSVLYLYAVANVAKGGQSSSTASEKNHAANGETATGGMPTM